MTTQTIDLTLDPSWSIGSRPHGGFVLSQITKTALDEAHPHPLAVSAHFLAAPNDSQAGLVEVQRLRTGRRVAASRVQFVQDGAVKVSALVSAGPVDAGSARQFSRDVLVDIPAPEDCTPMPVGLGNGIVFGPMTHLEARIDPRTAGWDSRPDDDRSETVVRAWLRRQDGPEVSPLDLITFVDTLPTAVMSRGFRGATATVELTFYLRALPAPGWIRADQRSLLLQDGWLDQTCLLWDSRGQLVAQGHQLFVYDARRLNGGIKARS
jgi:acyl-CoA thioesterase